MTLNWRQLVSIEVGGAICLPVILVGHKLFQSYGLVSSLIAIAIGNCLLLVMAYFFAEMSFQNKLPTTDNARHYFGDVGVKLFALTLLIAKCAWFAIQLDMMAEIFSESVFVKITLGLLIIAIALYGLKGLTLFSAISMPILIGTMGYAFYGSWDNVGVPLNEQITFEGISVAIAAAVTAVVDMPTYFRHSKSRFDSLIAVFIFIFMAVPLVEGLGIYLSYKNPGDSIMESLSVSQSAVWMVWSAFFLLLAGWTTNNTNLYSAANCFGTLFPKTSMKRRQVIIGFVGIILCCLEIPNHFVLVLQLLGVSVVSMGGVILCAYLFDSNSKHLNLLPWVLGTIVGSLTALNVFELSGIALVDALILSFFLTLIVSRYEISYNQ